MSRRQDIIDQVVEWQRHPITKRFMEYVNHEIHASRMSMVEDVVSEKFHGASQACGCIYSLERVLEYPRDLINDLKGGEDEA